jgi:hypothetical protein
VRYPSNADSLGIEIVGMANLPANFKALPQCARKSPSDVLGEFGIYEQPTVTQNASLKWLVDRLLDSMRIARSEIIRHPLDSWNNPTEAAGTKW